MNFNFNNKQRITQRKKDENKKQWYKDQADLLDSHSFSENHFIGFGGITEFKRMKVNYDLFNNIINTKDFEYVSKPFGAEGGDLPASFTNRDIVSGKIKVLLGMEMKMPFAWKLTAVNRDATTRKEEEEFGRIREYVIAEAMAPIQQQAKEQALAQQKGKPLTPEEQQQIQQQMQEEISAKTPDKVRKYMTREHQDPAEMLGTQLLEYLIQKERVADKFNKGFKHSNLSGKEVYFVGIRNGQPILEVTNSLFFDHDLSPDLDYIEDGEWAVNELRMTPGEVISNFGSQLKEEDIDRIYEYNSNPTHLYNSDFTFNTDKRNEPYTVRVLHTTWKSLRKIGFLTYWSDITQKEEMKLVNEDYKINAIQGDIDIDWQWIPEAHEVYKILNDIYVYARPVPGQNKDLDNLWHCKLPYYGATTDSLNSPVTCSMDRVKSYQYFYDVLLYRIELLIASDKGRKVAINVKSIPKSAGIDLKKWTYFFEANNIAWLNPSEEGNRGGDVTNMVKEIDMSTVSKINEYIQLAEYIEKKCGSAIGITPQMEAQISANEAVTNTQQNITMASHIIQPYFELHNNVKGNVLTALLETAKVAYTENPPGVLSYVLDDMSLRMFQVDQGLLESSRYGLFISNSSKAADAKRAVEGLAQSALQNSQADLADVIRVIRAESVTEAEELLEAANERKQDEAQRIERAKIQQQKDAELLARQHEERKWAHEKDLVVTKEKERRITEIQKQTELSLGFNEDKDIDDDGVPDVLEVAKFGVDADIKGRSEDRKDAEFQHKKEMDKEGIKIKNKELAIKKAKPTSK